MSKKENGDQLVYLMDFGSALQICGDYKKSNDVFLQAERLSEKYGSQIEILAGSGVNYNNASSLMKHTGVSQVHSSCKNYEEDPTTSGKSVTYSYYTGTHANDYESVDQENVEKLVSSLQNK